MTKLVAAVVAGMLLIVTSMSLGQSDRQQRRPNVIFIVVDDL